jgi:hypothetical protein
MYNYPKTAPNENIGMNIPPGIGQLRVRAVLTNFIRQNINKKPS